MLAQRHTWIWTVTPPRCRRACVRGSGELAAVVAGSGLEVVEDPAEADILLAELTAESAVDGLSPNEVGRAGLVAVALDGGSTELPEDASSILRAVELASSPIAAARTAARATALAASLSRTGFEVRVLPSGDRTRKHVIGGRGWMSMPRPPLGAVLVASRDGIEPSILDVAIAEAGRALGRPLAVRVRRVFESGKLLVELQGGGERYMLHISGGPRRLVMGSLASLRELAAAWPEPLTDMIPWPLADGEVGPVAYILQPWLPGSPPRRMTARLWDECLEFLVALHGLGRTPEADAHALIAATFDAQAEALAPHLEGRARMIVREIAARLAERLGDMPLGWSHGDFWNENMLVRDDRLRGVVDWDWATPRSLGALDCCDLLALSEQHNAGLPPGPRLARLWSELSDSGGRARRFMARYGERTGAASDAETLQALAVAHWLSRTARALFPQSYRALQPRWLAANLEEPLTALEALARSGSLSPIRSQHRRRNIEDTVVLCYHAISEDWPSDLAVRPSALEAQVRSLLERGYTAVTFEQALRSAHGRLFAVTFDDAYRSVFEHGYPVLRRLGVPASVFVVTSFVGAQRLMAWTELAGWASTSFADELMPMSWEQLAELEGQGWEIGSHTKSHPWLTRTAQRALDAELRDSGSEIAERLGHPCLSLAYPFGDRDTRVRSAAREAGYRYAASLPRLPHRALALDWPRVGVYRNTGRIRYLTKISPAVRYLSVVAATAGWTAG